MTPLAFSLSWPMLDLSSWQQIGLAFLLGSFTVATLSDLKYLSAQREFLEVWLGIVGVVLVANVVGLIRDPSWWPTFALRWGLIVALCFLSWRDVGVLFRLAFGDVAALAAAASLLPALYIGALFVFAKLFAWGLRPILAGDRRSWPFMPVVTLATLAVLALGWLIHGHV
jgi:hypothetical protein